MKLLVVVHFVLQYSNVSELQASPLIFEPLGNVTDLTTTELSAGARIRFVFYEEFVKKLQVRPLISSRYHVQLDQIDHDQISPTIGHFTYRWYHSI